MRLWLNCDLFVIFLCLEKMAFLKHTQNQLHIQNSQNTRNQITQYSHPLLVNKSCRHVACFAGEIHEWKHRKWQRYTEKNL